MTIDHRHTNPLNQRTLRFRIDREGTHRYAVQDAYDKSHNGPLFKTAAGAITFALKTVEAEADRLQVKLAAESHLDRESKATLSHLLALYRSEACYHFQCLQAAHNAEAESRTRAN